MFIDFEAGGDVPPEADVVVVGAGIAGLILAVSLSPRLRVLVVEGGGLSDEIRSQDLFDGAESVGPRNQGVTAGRFRTYGGAATRWGGQLIPFAPQEFAGVPGYPHGDWPITPDELAPHADRVGTLLGLGEVPFDGAAFPKTGRTPLPFDERVIATRLSKWLPWGKRNVGRWLTPRLRRKGNVDVLYHANVVALPVADGGTRVRGVRVRSYGGREVTIGARCVILAAGALESARLLLVSGGGGHPGLGNDAGWVGRTFMDHVCVRIGAVVPVDRRRFLQGVRPFFVGDVLHTPRFELAAEARREHGGLNAFAQIVFENAPDSPWVLVRDTLKHVQRVGARGLLGQAAGSGGAGPAGRPMSRSVLWSMMRELPDVVAGAIARTALGLRPIPTRSTPMAYLFCEQPPRRDSFVALSDATDALGMPKLVVNWRIGTEEQETAQVLARLFAEQLRKTGTGAISWLDGRDPGVAANLPLPLDDVYHHMGTTRMARDPSQGVVDADGKVFGTDNLFVCGASVFPSGGCSNPGFTTMCLAARLAEHITALSQDGARRGAAAGG